MRVFQQRGEIGVARGATRERQRRVAEVEVTQRHSERVRLAQASVRP